MNFVSLFFAYFPNLTSNLTGTYSKLVRAKLIFLHNSSQLLLILSVMVIIKIYDRKKSWFEIYVRHCVSESVKQYEYLDTIVKLKSLFGGYQFIYCIHYTVGTDYSTHLCQIIQCLLIP